MTVPQTAHVARRARLSPHATFVLLVVMLLAVVAGLTVATHEVYEAVTAGNGVELLDHPAMSTAMSLRSPGFTTAAVTLTRMAGRVGTPAFGVLALALFTWRRRDWTPTVLLLTGLLGSLLVTVVGKRILGRVRPPREFALPPFETSPSFPSGHTLNATVLAVLVAYLVLITVSAVALRWLAVALCTVYPVLVGLSRVYLGQHWLTDVMAGLFIGIAWSCAVILAHRVRLEMRGRRQRHLVPDQV